MVTAGTLYGVGVGPGDPELLTLKAVRILQQVPIIAYPATPGGGSQARDIAASWLEGKIEVPIDMPCRMDRGPVNQAYDAAAERLGAELATGRDVAILCEGDPLFYGSFAYLLQRLGTRFPCEVIPGISSVGAVAAVTGRPLATGSDRIGIIPATAGEAEIRRALQELDSVAILKPGRLRPRIVALLAETGRMRDAVYVEQVTRPQQWIVTRVADLEPVPGPYFSLFLVTRRS